MAKGVPKELRVAYRKLLGDSVNAKPGALIAATGGTDPLERDAMHYLRDIRAFEELSSGRFRLTAYGREYWDKITTFPPWYWFKQNWFPATVAAATILASVGGIVANALD